MASTPVTPTTENNMPTAAQAAEQALNAQINEQQNQETATPQQTNQQVDPPDSTQSQPQNQPSNQQPQSQTQQQNQEPTQEEIQQALNLQKLLMDPKTAPSALRMMGELLGLQVSPNQPAPQQNENKQPSIGEIVAASLGEEYKFLAPQLAKAFEQVISTQVAPLQTQIQQTKMETEFNEAVAKLNKTSNGDFDKHEAAILQLMDRLKPAAGVSVHDYLNELYTLAKGKSPIINTPQKQVQQVVDKMKQNAQENIPSPSAATENRVVKGPALPTLAQAIEAAARGETFE